MKIFGKTYVTAAEKAERKKQVLATEFRFTDSLYTQSEINELLKEQREMYADAVIAELKNMGFQLYVIGEARIRKACINAGEKA